VVLIRQRYRQTDGQKDKTDDLQSQYSEMHVVRLQELS